jgi:Ca2+-binding RTX toxin-like protein
MPQKHHFEKDCHYPAGRGVEMKKNLNHDQDDILISSLGNWRAYPFGDSAEYLGSGNGGDMFVGGLPTSIPFGIAAIDIFGLSVSPLITPPGGGIAHAGNGSHGQQRVILHPPGEGHPIAVDSADQGFTLSDLQTLSVQLTDGYWNATSRSYRSFDISAGGTLVVDISALTTEGQMLAQWALEAWTAVSGINFSYAVGGTVDISFDDNNPNAYSGSYVSGHEITSSYVNISVDWISYYGFTKDTYSLQTYIHEIGHALGLGHAGNYNGSATFGTDNLFNFDSWQTSVMSYFSQYENTFLNASYAYLLTPMVADIIAIRSLYGTTTIHGGDDTYTYPGDLFASSVALTLVDTGGIDTVDFSEFSVNQVIDLRDGYYSDVGGLKGNLAISVDTQIEIALSGSGNDTVIGNSAANSLDGGSGGDTLTGGGGDDIIIGGGGSDTANYSGAFDDYSITYNSDGSFTITDLVGAEGVDTVRSTEWLRFSDRVVKLGPPPTVANAIDDQTAVEDAAFNFTFATSVFDDVDGDLLIYSATLGDGSALPSWLSFDPATRTFSGTPENGDVGIISVKVTASDGLFNVSDVFTITIANVNDAPTVANALADQSASEDTSFSFTFPANAFVDVDASDTLTYTATLESGAALPSWLTFDAASRTFSGTPLNGDVGTLSIRITASDGQLSVSDLFSITIANVNDAPTVDHPIANQSAIADSIFSFTFAATTFGDVDTGDVITYTATLQDGGSLPSWLTFDPTTRTFSGTPTSGDLGTIAVKVTASDGTASVSDVFDLTISDGPHAPVVATPVPDQAATEDTTFSFTFAADAFTDADGDTLTYTATLESGAALPSWLTFDAASRTFSGTPLNGDVGTLSIRITASDGQLSVSDLFSIAISNVNDAPTNVMLSNDTVVENSTAGTLVGLVSATEVDQGDSLVFSLIDSSGVFELQGNALLVADGATIDYETQQSYTITLRATDESGAFTEQEMVIEVGDLVTKVKGTAFRNTLTGTIGRDEIKGLGGNDKLLALAGDDILDGGLGKDKMTGGGGVDTFVFGRRYGTDTVVDFDTSDLTHDKIDLSNAVGITSFSDLMRHHVDIRGSDLHIVAQDRSTLILRQTGAWELDTDMFSF